MKNKVLIALSVCLLCFATVVSAQSLTAAEEQRVEKAFKTANELLEKDKPREALKFYGEALAILPKNPAILFNAGMAAFSVDEYDKALDYWKRLKAVDAEDWRARSKLIQVYHSLKNEAEAMRERAELFELRKSGKLADLSQEDFYCREQFRLGSYKVVAFEHFELKGDRALRYAFMINKEDGTEEFKISLGSYDLTNRIWQEMEKRKEGSRLFHLDGYFKWGHATYGMYPEEPTYSVVRGKVVDILDGKNKPVSSSQIVK